MAGPRGYTTLRGKDPQLRFATWAVEYDCGELYFDRVGRVVRELARHDNGWLRHAEIATNKSTIINPGADLVAEVSPTSVSMTINRETRSQIVESAEIAVLIDESEALWTIVRDELEIESLQRIGYRERFMFPCESVEDAENWIRETGLMTVAPSLYSTFGQEHFALSWVLIVVGDECRYRIEMRGTERPAKIRVGQGEVSVQESHAKRRNKKELLALLKKKREQQFDPEFSVLLNTRFLLSEQEISGS